MDTGTHVVMGLALGGLATLDPVVGGSTVTAASVMIGTIIGSQIPDIDTVLKLKNNASYIRNHRGITHSIPAVLLWPILITAVIYMIFPGTNLLHLWLWTFFAVFLHVFVDIFNAYGTQALRPFSSKWVALGMINTFDPFIFGIHIFGLFLWVFGMDPGYTFLAIYGILIIYYFCRYFAKRSVYNGVKDIIPDATEIIISPTMRYNQWRIAVKNKDKFFVGRAVKGRVRIIDQFKRVPIPNSPIINAAKEDRNISAFLSFSPVYRWEIESVENMYEIRFIDLRYRSNEYYPFVAVIHMDKDLTVINSYTGWIFSEEKLRKKLDIITN
ncbi:inner membrane protein [Cytobacillus horneckiae]|uniref:Metal-dependent hydrolase n=1 Tax=Cytobacillus horneckiae TaxID=549687 RepID=A0A2N0ZGK0_9BACI|nr:metal-dependent hydrolase [Cytobacillus horneckiae]MBN6888292.1 metal-dependent hydrolase [Cytobacillus horneckiae]MCM3177147.1 metal-dependent hydrolase [Cytobacillus horneckiae]MEC1154846.1 metal-dependent hydrolase [Cytobacillus horneckiae]MED2940340.1 metal-dependent hydrolase [Cytobacillus horneckiae]PKG28641.1 metal-dependent hydrolase [Cytobacillus horneckiae]